MILLVDDNRVGREALAKILQFHGHEVIEAADANHGLAILDGNRVDLIITDFVMPQMSGFQFIDEVRKRWPDARILMMSGYLTPELGKILSGNLGFLAKPIDVAVLLETIGRIIPQPQAV